MKAPGDQFNVMPEYLSIQEAAIHLGVCSATIRNWIKTGYLTLLDHGIPRGSILSFIKEHAGKDKLTHRANKSQKQSQKASNRIDLIQSAILTQLEIEIDLKTLSDQYQAELGDTYRNKEGIYYTPAEIVEQFMIPITVTADMTFCDPCCGAGAFLIWALNRGVHPANIYGYDVDPVAVAMTQKRLHAMTGHDFSTQIVCSDYLKSPVTDPQQYDLIYTNPPWGKKLSKHEKAEITAQWDYGKSVDTCSMFLLKALKQLSPGGALGFLLPDSFLNIGVFEDVRRHTLEYQLTHILDLGNAFKGLQHNACGIILKNLPADARASIACVSIDSPDLTHLRYTHEFQRNPKAIINAWCHSQDQKIIAHLFQQDHLTLEKHAGWGMGIVTGNNKKHCYDKPPTADYIPVLRGVDLNESANASVWIHQDFTRYQQVAPMTLYQADEKLIYRFISSSLCFFYDDQQRYFLNSANMLIPYPDFPISTRQLGELLNSRLLNWIFAHIFRTHKILRSDLQTLPIHSEYFQTHDVFNDENFEAYLGVEWCDGHYELSTAAVK